jgi:hypothetical protein
MGCTCRTQSYTYGRLSNGKGALEDSSVHLTVGWRADYCDLSLASILILLSDGRCLNKLRNLNNNYDVVLKSHTLLHIV